MTNLEKKIAAFKREAGDKSQYTPEQQKIYAAFTKLNGKDTNFAVIDQEGITIRFFIKSSAGAKHILDEHYLVERGKVTAKEILNMLDVIRTGKKTFENDSYVYRKKYTINGFTYTVVLRLIKANGKIALKTFYSNRGYK